MDANKRILKKDCHVVLINVIPSNYSKGGLSLPLGLLYLASVLEQQGYKVLLLDSNLNENFLSEIEEEIKYINAPVFGISSFLCGYMFVKKLVEIIRKIAPSSKVVLGGPITYGAPDVVAENAGVDAVIVGEAEVCLPELIKAVFFNEKPSNIAGVYSMVNGKVKPPSKPQELVQHLDKMPFPAWHLVDMEFYIKHYMLAWHSKEMRSISVFSSRGCPYSCNFCCKTSGKKLRIRSIYNIKEEIELLIGRYKINDIMFDDDNFAVTEERAFEMCDMLEKFKDLTFACSMRVDRITDKTLKAMKKAGCRTIFYGVESGSENVLNAMMNKGFTVEQAGEAIIKTREYGIEAYCNFMCGYPGETEETFKETVEFMKKHMLYSGFGFATPFPGTKLYDEAVSKGKIKDVIKFIELYSESVENAHSNAFPFTINLTDIPDERLLTLRRLAQRELFSQRIVLNV